MGRPAASAEVQPAGRVWFVARSHTADELTRKPPPVRSVLNSSNSRQSPWRITRTCRSPDEGSGSPVLPPSICTSSGMGIGPGSLSSE
jgi:hypothetical protein